MCPLSNIKLRVFDVMGGHNLRALLDAGLAATVNSDDPAYFGGYVNDNYLAAFEALPLDACACAPAGAQQFCGSLPRAGAASSAYLDEVDAFLRRQPMTRSDHITTPC